MPFQNQGSGDSLSLFKSWFPLASGGVWASSFLSLCFFVCLLCKGRLVIVAESHGCGEGSERQRLKAAILARSLPCPKHVIMPGALVIAIQR